MSVVMPAYNEEAGIQRAVVEVQRHVLRRVPDAELIVVDDGSLDATGGLLDGLAEEVSGLYVIHRPNGGHGAALCTGLDAARGAYVFLLDSDRQVPLEAFRGLWEAAQRCDGVFGVRVPRLDPRLRNVLSRLLRQVVRTLFGVRLEDPNAPFKIIRRSVWVEARRYMPPRALTPSLFLAIYARRAGMDVVERAVPHRPRQTGKSSIRSWKLLAFSGQAFLQLLRFRRRLGAAPALDVESETSQHAPVS